MDLIIKIEKKHRDTGIILFSFIADGCIFVMLRSFGDIFFDNSECVIPIMKVISNLSYVFFLIFLIRRDAFNAQILAVDYRYFWLSG